MYGGRVCVVRRGLSEWPKSQILKGNKDTITKRIEGVLQRGYFIQGPQGGDEPDILGS